jgi:hypothetical protein
MFSQFEPQLDANETKLFANIGKMNPGFGFDAVIVVCGSEEQAEFWTARIENTVDQVTKSGAILQVVTEDWEGGAGNALGSLYAFKKAHAAIKARDGDYSKDILNMMKSGSSVAIYHSAGKGTRLAPLSISECNNKPAVKLPATVDINGEKVHMTILESVILSTAPYAKGRNGRLSVFWADQVFVPQEFARSGEFAADILSFSGAMPTQEEWVAQGLSSYGLVAANADGSACQIEKASDVASASAVLAAAGFSAPTKVGPSLGSFSVSHQLLEALMTEFQPELDAKHGKMDTDAHLWMAFSLPEATYADALQAKFSKPDLIAHHKRMSAFKANFVTHNGPKFFGMVDAGAKATSYYWDFGQLNGFFKNSMTVLDAENHGYALRKFFGIPLTAMELDSNTGATEVDDDSLFLTSNLTGGNVERSLVVGCDIHNITATNCLLINVTAKKINATGAFLYNVFDSSEEGITVGEGEVYTSVMHAGGQPVVVKSHIDTDGGAAWDAPVHGNAKSFAQLYQDNVGQNVVGSFARYQELQSEHGFLRSNE